MLTVIASITDRLEHYWEHIIMKRYTGITLVVVYLFMIVLVEFNRQGWLSGPIAEWLPMSHFFAVEVTFTLLLVTEVIALVFSLTRSFSRSVGIQVEILALILIRDTFKKFTEFGEPLEWSTVSPHMGAMIADSAGALLIFVVLGLYYRVQKHRPITADEVEQATFVTYKKIIALALVAAFGFIAAVDGIRLVTGQPVFPFFETFYTVLIFTDILMVLLSLRFTNSFAVTFRNFGFAVVTVFIRISLIAPPPLNAAIGVGTALFALGLSYVYNRYGALIQQQSQIETTHENTETSEQRQVEAQQQPDPEPAGA